MISYITILSMNQSDNEWVNKAINYMIDPKMAADPLKPP